LIQPSEQILLLLNLCKKGPYVLNMIRCTGLRLGENDVSVRTSHFGIKQISEQSDVVLSDRNVFL